MDQFKDLFNKAGYKQAVHLRPDSDEVTLSVMRPYGFHKSSSWVSRKETFYIHENVREAIDNLQKDAPATENLPPHIQDFLSSISGMSNRDKINHIHSYVIANMDYDIEEALTEKKSDTSYDIIKDYHTRTENGHTQHYYKGDCDNHATMMTLLMIKAGIPRDSIAWIPADVQYKGEGMNDGGGHAVCIVHCDNQYLLMDMNLQNPVELDENLQAKGAQVSTEHTDGYEAHTDVKIIPQGYVPVEQNTGAVSFSTNPNDYSKKPPKTDAPKK